MTFNPPKGSFEMRSMPGHYLPKQHYMLIDSATIRRRTDEMADFLSDYMEVCHQKGIGVTTVWLLDGAARVFANLQESMRFKGHIPVSCKASSYEEDESRELVYDETKLTADKICGRVVFLIDDIVDTAQTMFLLKQRLLELGALQVITVALLDKPTGRHPEYQDFVPDVSGFIVPDAWVFGRSMDDGFKPGKEYAGGEWPLDNSWVRNLDDIWYYDEAGCPDLREDVSAPEFEPLPLAA